MHFDLQHSSFHYSLSFRGKCWNYSKTYNFTNICLFLRKTDPGMGENLILLLSASLALKLVAFSSKTHLNGC